jgi:hypothetical protein
LIDPMRRGFGSEGKAKAKGEIPKGGAARTKQIKRIREPARMPLCLTASRRYVKHPRQVKNAGRRPAVRIQGEERRTRSLGVPSIFLCCHAWLVASASFFFAACWRIYATERQKSRQGCWRYVTFVLWAN